MLVHFATRAATFISYIRGSPFTKHVTIEDFWNFELDVQCGFDVPFYVRFGFLQRGHLNQQYCKKDTFSRPTVPNAHCFIGNEIYPDAGKVVSIFLIEILRPINDCLFFQKTFYTR